MMEKRVETKRENGTEIVTILVFMGIRVSLGVSIIRILPCCCQAWHFELETCERCHRSFHLTLLVLLPILQTSSSLVFFGFGAVFFGFGAVFFGIVSCPCSQFQCCT